MTNLGTKFGVGQKFSVTKTITEQDVKVFAGLSGDTQPLHLDAAYAAGTRFKKQVAHGSILVGFISSVLGVEMAGPDHTVVFLGQSTRFLQPVFFGDTITAECEITNVREDKPIVSMSCSCTNQKGEEVLTGDAAAWIDSYPFDS